MVETKLIRPGNRAVEAWCPVCGHVRRTYSNTRQGIMHCIYCGADFEWMENETPENGVLRDRVEWAPALQTAPALQG